MHVHDFALARDEGHDAAGFAAVNESLHPLMQPSEPLGRNADAFGRCGRLLLRNRRIERQRHVPPK